MGRTSLEIPNLFLSIWVFFNIVLLNQINTHNTIFKYFLGLKIGQSVQLRVNNGCGISHFTVQEGKKGKKVYLQQKFLVVQTIHTHSQGRCKDKKPALFVCTDAERCSRNDLKLPLILHLKTKIKIYKDLVFDHECSSGQSLFKSCNSNTSFMFNECSDPNVYMLLISKYLGVVLGRVFK